MRTVLVLNDGKAGHLNQSLAVARQIQKARQLYHGRQMEDTKIVVVTVAFKSAFRRALLSAAAVFATWRCHGRTGLLKFCLEENSYDSLMKAYSEFLVSCGSSLSAVNIFMAKENDAKNIVIMKPNIPFCLGKYSLALIPKHDIPPHAKNVVETTIAPNLVDKDRIAGDGDKIRGVTGLCGGDIIGLFIGGDNPEFSLSPRVASNAIDSILRFCETRNAHLLVTTSRRTSPEVEDLLRQRLKAHPRCKLLVLANERNLEGAVGGILHLSRIAIVSEESVSMVSEAVSSGRKVVVFELEKRTSGVTKHEKALRDLEAQGCLAISRPYALSEALEQAWNDARPVKRLDDEAKILEAVRRLI